MIRIKGNIIIILIIIIKNEIIKKTGQSLFGNIHCRLESVMVLF